VPEGERLRRERRLTLELGRNERLEHRAGEAIVPPQSPVVRTNERTEQPGVGEVELRGLDLALPRWLFAVLPSTPASRASAS
jgi:hypothetical protein